MTRSKRLEPVIQHNEKKEQQALLQVASSRGALELERQRLERLHQYRVEYQQRGGQGGSLFSPIELQEYHRFMAQLDETIERQAQLVELRGRELLEKQKLWNSTRIDSKKMHKVVEKLNQQEFVEMEREEQKALDEFAQRGNKRR